MKGSGFRQWLNTVLTGSAVLIAVLATLAIGAGGWELKRWANWKLSYGVKVDRRVETLERRVAALERGHRIVNGVETCDQTDCPICNDQQERRPR